HLVNVFEVTSDGHSHRDARDADAERFEEPADVTGGGLAFGVWVCGEYDFANFDAVVVLWPQARQKVRQTQVFGAESPYGRERAVQDVVEAVVASGLLDGDEVVRLFDDADHRAVARSRSA